ncbi:MULTISPECIES: TrmB family transcriptional regulator [Acidiplasma]|jgi:sugar-specific transcriptional regulator TrmB|uniref:Transcriptional regulator n=3 Tax=Acidiplasma TaxID=507753 RepID=A0A0Q0WLM9_9ARCH|nr:MULTISPECIES: TrmB family transcriptional regulator [Acidiplasma]KJE49281.1 transcriptional regulator [Acidiplasma sp. MBA-1]KPV46254.1 transcriptional regulator [Acidiplasma aeolicum]KQB36674.1 transcriptional regulator [Acidiplasma cupricumulans]WMT54741.1 MAG: TrmB family transcriptional regulator [Acidiplasma sp.]
MEANSEYIMKTADMLKILGLSSYEAQAFAALVYHGVANADTIADTAGIPRTSAYKVMESLVEKGFAKETEGRPRMFKPEEMDKIKDNFISKVNNLFERLKELQDVLPSKGDPQLVYTIYGRSKVMAKMAEMFDLSEREILIATPRIKEIRTELKKNIDNAIKRGVHVIFITPPNKRVPPNTEVYRKEGLIATDVASDESRAMLAGADLDACGYTDNPILSLHVLQFIHMMINNDEYKI